jgi:hypothetical protein
MQAKGPKVNKIPRSVGNAQPPIHSGSASGMASNFDDIPLPKGVGAEGGPATFEELLLRSLAKEGGTQPGDTSAQPQPRSLPRPTVTQHSPLSKSAHRPSVNAQLTRTSTTSTEPESHVSSSFHSVRSSSEFEESARSSFEQKHHMKPLPFTSPEAVRVQQPRAYELIGSRLDQTRDEELEEFQHLEQQLMNESATGRRVFMQRPASLASSTTATMSAPAAAQQHLEGSVDNGRSFRHFNAESHGGDEGFVDNMQRPPMRTMPATSTFSSSSRRPATAAPPVRSHTFAPAIRTAAAAPIDSASSDDDDGAAGAGSELVSKMWGKQSRKALQAQVVALKEQISAATSHRKELEQRCAALEDEAAAVKAELMRTKRVVKDLEQQREQLSSNREDVSSLVASARKEIEAEKNAEVRKAKKLQEAAEHRARVSDIAVGELKQQLQALTAQFDETKAGIRERESRLKGSADSLKSQVEVLRQRNEELQQQLQIAESQLVANTHHAAGKSASNSSASARTSARLTEAAAAASPTSAGARGARSAPHEGFKPSSSQFTSDNDEHRVAPLKPSSAINTAVPDAVSKFDQNPAHEEEEREITHADGKRELHRRDGSKTILFPSGHRKEIRTDGSTEVKLILLHWQFYLLLYVASS